MSSDRSDWFCCKCGKYSDPQHLDYNTGECWTCQDGVVDSNMYKAPTQEQLESIWKQVNDWQKGPTSVMFSSSMGVARVAIGEFIANGMGCTLYHETFPELLESKAKQG